MTKPLIEPEELLNLVKTPGVILVDAGDSSSYADHHLKGAVYADLNTDLADVPENPADGGRHPLPLSEKFGLVLGRMGITPTSHVVVYDNKYGANAAARFWWMLKAAGHEKVQVLNGGLAAATRAGFVLSDLLEMPEPAAPYNFASWQLPIAFIDEVEAASLTGDCTIIDVRESARYNGETEPIDTVAGHIPGAINIPYASNLDENGMFLPPEALREKYGNAGRRPLSESIIHCGSGVTACHTLLAIAHAGLPLPRLYVGSWSEWSRNDKAIVGKS